MPDERHNEKACDIHLSTQLRGVRDVAIQVRCSSKSQRWVWPFVMIGMVSAEMVARSDVHVDAMLS